MKLILLGAPGAGKGTQAEFVSEKLSIPVIGTGNIIREAVRDNTPEGIRAKEYMDKGNLVPDEIVIGMIKSKVQSSDCQNGFILDGFPRNVLQAQALDKMGIEIDRVIDLEVSDQRIVERMGGRRVCKDCGSSYHIDFKPSLLNGKCDKCSGELVIRKDDKPETVIERLKVYHEHTEPLKNYYKSAGKLRVVEGQEKVEDTTKLTLAALEA